MIRFAQNVKEWMLADPRNVISVHCKGGKGRTGTMVCVWLIESGKFKTAEVIKINKKWFKNELNFIFV
jgi:PTEN homologous phosphatase